MAYNDPIERRPILEYLPPFLREIREYKNVLQAGQEEADDIREELDVLRNRAFVDTADEIGIKRFEEVMGIRPLTGQSLEDRRSVVRATMTNLPPYTDETLEAKLTLLCGSSDAYVIERDYANYALSVKLALENKHFYRAVNSMLRRILPCNLDYECDLLYNTWEMVSRFTWADAASMTWAEIKEEVLP